MHNIYTFNRHTKFVSNDLREGGVVTLAMTVRSGEYIYRSGGIDANRCRS